MIIPIYAYGHAVLKTVAKEIDKDYPDLNELIRNMWDTMYNAQGVGLAAPQVGRAIRLFLVDTKQLDTEEEGSEKGLKEVFINAQVLEETGDHWSYEEGCLSIPNIRGEVERPSDLIIKYQNAEFEWVEKAFTGRNARVIQHEYDHIEGVLFTEKLKPVKRNLIRRKLDAMRKGKADCDYPIRFVKK